MILTQINNIRVLENSEYRATALSEILVLMGKTFNCNKLSKGWDFQFQADDQEVSKFKELGFYIFKQQKTPRF